MRAGPSRLKEGARGSRAEMQGGAAEVERKSSSCWLSRAMRKAPCIVRRWSPFGSASDRPHHCGAAAEETGVMVRRGGGGRDPV